MTNSSLRVGVASPTRPAAGSIRALPVPSPDLRVGLTGASSLIAKVRLDLLVILVRGVPPRVSVPAWVYLVLATSLWPAGIGAATLALHSSPLPTGPSGRTGA